MLHLDLISLVCFRIHLYERFAAWTHCRCIKPKSPGNPWQSGNKIGLSLYSELILSEQMPKLDQYHRISFSSK